MPAPGAGGVQASLVGTVQGMMASARAAFRRKPGPAPGAPTQSPGGNPPDLTQFSETFEPSGGLFAPGYPTGEDADETGIVVAGKDADGHGYVLADQSARWARTAIALYRQHKADRIVAEVTTAAIWWRPRSGWSTRMSPTTKCTLHAARSLELNRWRRFTSRAAFTTSARSRHLRISSARSRRILTVRLRNSHQTGSMRWSGR